MGREAPRYSRWWLVAASAAAMAVAGAYQFVWSTVRVPLGGQLGASEAALGTVFTLFVVFQTVSQFPAGWVRDRWGPRRPLLVGAVLAAAGFAGTALAATVEQVYLWYALGGVGAGIVYTVAVNTPVKWFDERRGLATGVVTMAYGGGSVLLIPVVRSGAAGGLTASLLLLGALAGGTILVAAAVIVDRPAASAADAAPSEPSAHTWRDAVRTWQFWLLYGVFVAVNGVGLMLIGKVIAYADGLGLSAAAATGSASLIALADAAGIVVIAGVSDALGRERTVAGSLLLCGVALAGAVAAGERGVELAFVGLVGAAAFFRSPAFAVFPSLVGEYYGVRHSSTNYSLLYTAKLWGGVLGGAGASAVVVAVGWSPTFLLGAAVIAAAGVAMLFLRPV